MGFDNNWPNRKDHRAEYRKAKRVDRTCRNHGSCPYCSRGREHTEHKRIVSAKEQEKEFKIGDGK